MSALEALLGGNAPTPAPAPSGDSALERLLKPAKPAARSEFSPSGGLDLGADPGLSFDGEPSFQSGGGVFLSKKGRKRYDEEQARLDAEKNPPPIGAAKSALAGAADAVDLLVTGIFGMPVAAAADAAIRATPGATRTVPAVGVVNALQYAGQRLGGKLTGDKTAGMEILEASVGGTRKEVGQRAQDSTQVIMGSLGQPARDLLRTVGLLPANYKSATDKGLSWAMEKVDEVGLAIQKKTGGAITQEDVQSVVTYTFGLMGAKGVEASVKAGIDAAKAREVFKELEALKGERAGERMKEGEAIAEAEAISQPTQIKALRPDELRQQATDEAKARRERRKEVRAAFAEDPVWADRQAGQAEYADFQRRGPALPPQPGGPTRLDGPGYQAGAAARVSTEPTRLVPDARRGIARPEDLTSALAKTAQGRPFDLTAPEKIALRASRAVRDPKVITAAAVGATGLGLAMMMEPDEREAALAVGAGALILGKGKELSLEAIRNTPDATPLRALLDRDTTTLGTLELLARQSPGRFEFSVDSIKQLLKRPEVTKAEREVFDRILEGRPEGATTITAKELMEGKKIATADFELKKETLDTHANYGLENIDRLEISERWDAMPGEDAISVDELSGPKAETIAYRLPPEIDSKALGDLVRTAEGGHTYFNDAFGHTRHFIENGVRHVVEVQSNIAQYLDKALRGAKPLEGEALAAAESKLKWAEGMGDFWANINYVVGRAGEYDAFAALRAFKKKEANLTELLGHSDQTLMLEDTVYSSLVDQAKAEFDAQWLKKNPQFDAVPSGYDISDGVLDWVLARPEYNLPSLRMAIQSFAGKQVRNAGVWLEEAKGAFSSAGAATPAALAAAKRIDPMLKDWHKRLIREELADGARAGETTVRFADADTVAKVEGWPKQNDAITRDARQSVEAAERNLTEMEARLQTRGGATPAEQAEARELIPVIREDIRRAREAYAAARDAQVPTFLPKHQGIYDRYSRDVTKFLKQLGGTHVVDSAGHGWWEVPVEGSKQLPAGKRAQQFGGLDADLAASVAAIGGGAALVAWLSSPEERKKNAALAAAVIGLGIYAKSRSPQVAHWAERAAAGAEYALGEVSTRVGNMSKPLLHRMREHERRVLTTTHDYLKATAPFVEGLRRAPKEVREKLNLAILSGDAAETIRLIGKAGVPGLVVEWQKARKLLDKVGGDLVGAGRLKGLLPDYYPRLVIDVPGLMEALGKEQRSYLEQQLKNAREKAMRFDGRDLSPLETSQIINKVLKTEPKGGRPGYLKRRSIESIDEKLAPFYAPATESLPLYLRSVAKELERARFFGDDLVRESQSGLTNLDLSIGNVVNRERLAGRITDAQIDELAGILRSRFGPGERVAATPIQTMKNLTNAGLLGHVTSAFVQTGDLAVAMAAQGFLPTVKALQQIITRNPARATMNDLGLINHISEEFVSAGRQPLTIAGRQISSAKFLEKVFKFSGFSLVDQLGKATAINAAYNRLHGLAKTEAGMAKLRAQYGEAYGADFAQLAADLRSRTLSDHVKGALFSELSDIQPISKLEVPQAYLDMPNGRAVYMLKTFMLKQIDIARREVVGRFRKGDYKGATEKALKFGLALGIAGATTDYVRDWLLGRDAKLEASDIPMNMLKTFGWSQYVVDKARQGKPIEAVGQVVLPPYQMWDRIVSADPSAVQYLPIVGRLLYNDVIPGQAAVGLRFGGAERANKAREKRAAQDERKALGLTKENLDE